MAEKRETESENRRCNAAKHEMAKNMKTGVEASLACCTARARPSDEQNPLLFAADFVKACGGLEEAKSALKRFELICGILG